MTFFLATAIPKRIIINKKAKTSKKKEIIIWNYFSISLVIVSWRMPEIFQLIFKRLCAEVSGFSIQYPADWQPNSSLYTRTPIFGPQIASGQHQPVVRLKSMTQMSHHGNLHVCLPCQSTLQPWGCQSKMHLAWRQGLLQCRESRVRTTRKKGVSFLIQPPNPAYFLLVCCFSHSLRLLCTDPPSCFCQLIFWPNF
jgi:hypothetical protein